ncbi:MAG: hypothetical protein KatS3mg108_1818 [Isosphaeraceae bacterium]|jgi:membrane associated rhomboid family serine protease|nr:MAG: hypothetical protein KatS3mg108_1818 [Isosphaeraceae bacterium]
MNSAAADDRARSPQPDDATGVDGPDRYPATLLLCAIWTTLYLLMAWHQGTLHANPASWLSGGIRPQTAYIFGALTTADIQRGELWRLLTATMLHFSFVHLAINAWVLFQLGRMIEPWYGSSLFVTAYVVIGGGANLIAALLRPWTGQSVWLQSGGGSGVICGLIALVGYVGWRTRTRFGAYMLRQMAIQLLLIGAMGWLIPQIDNLVHAAGAFMGLLVGLADRPMLAEAGKPIARLIGTAATILLAAAGLAQAQTQQRQEQLQRDLLQRVARLDVARRSLGLAAAAVRDLASQPDSPDYPSWLRRDAARSLLTSALNSLRSEPTLSAKASEDLERFVRLGSIALTRRPDPAQLRLLRQSEQRLSSLLVEEQQALIRQLQELERHRGPVKIRLPVTMSLTVDRSAGQIYALAVPGAEPSALQATHQILERPDRLLVLGKVTPHDLALMRIA